MGKYRGEKIKSKHTFYVLTTLVIFKINNNNNDSNNNKEEYLRIPR